MSALVKEVLPKAYAETAHIEDKQDYANPTEILMSKITNADIAEVHALESRSYSFPWSQIIFSDCINSRYECWMMKQSDKVVAYSIMTLGMDESHFLLRSPHQKAAAWKDLQFACNNNRRSL